MLTITTQEYSRTLLNKLQTQRQRKPLSGIWELTHRCNLKCVHCYCKREPDKKELSLNEAKNIIDQIVKAGCLWLTFTGGEIFQRPDFLDIYTYAKRKGLIITLLTNGTLITESIAKYLAQYPPSLVEITLYGRTQKTYEKITRVNGSYEQCLKAIQLLRQYEIPFVLKTMLLTLNQHELWEIKKFAQELGSPRFYFDPLVHSKCNGSQEPIAFRLPVTEAVEMECQDTERMEHIRTYFNKHYGKTTQDFPYQYKCGAGRTMFAINPYGELNICLASQALNYDLRQGSFRDAFANVFPDIINAPRGNLYRKCSDCKLFGFCHQCPAKSARECGSDKTIVNYNCQRAKLLARRLQMAENRKLMTEDRKLIKSHSNRDS